MIKKKGNGHNLCFAVKYSLGTQQQKNDYNLAKGLRINYCKGGGMRTRKATSVDWRPGRSA